ARKNDALAHRRIAGAAHADDDEPSFEDREPLRDVVIDDVVINDRTRKTAVDELRSEGLSRADELGDVVLFQAPPLFFVQRSGDDGAGRGGVDFGDVVFFGAGGGN